MPNIKIVDPVKANVITSLETLSSRGNIYIVSVGIILIPKGDYLALSISNPIGSGKILSLGNICVSSVVQSSFLIYRNLPFVGGTDIIPRNGNNKFGDNCAATAEYKILTSEPTGGSEVLIGGFIQESGVTIYPCDGNVQIAPNTSITCLAHNMSTVNDGYIGLNIVLIES
ncbi:hypothetical protein [Paramaledivibacter caminithermalis]|jgi:hypothetical protein|uniref:Uncharacterized protein n=1 Tax=Paramaledivibacter caminithermalis (strain DSM 15212 / CIP 107654 / DViRD3) TaxID=1121301 RepID=A0A1M6JRU3_PARC5|nr:hypothetical protein [Paramaledivibacter caminithermalis]SHJ49409.1 hypothetical protein SAMN02745912_00118 [Paramaledivibacter caminithermalis DSM 15212]